MKKVNRLICIVCAVLLAVLLVGFNDAGDAAADEETDSSESSASLETGGCDHYYRIAAYIYISTFEYWNYDLVCIKCGDRQTVSADITLEVVTEPSCTEDGTGIYTAAAQYNNQSFTVSVEGAIAAAGHTEADPVTENLIEASCEEAGSYDVAVYCSVCGEELSRETFEIPAPGHTYEASVTEPTCTEEGYITYTCTVCGDTYIDDYVEALGHTYEAAATYPTCTEEGYITYTCTVCGNEYIDDYVEALGHTYEAVVTEPTCTEEGYTTYTCTVCGNEYIDDYVEALGHTYEAVVTEPTCTEDGYITYTCSVCGDEYTASGEPAAGHSYGSVIGWNWSDDHTSCTAVFVCANDETHTQTVEADITVQTLESSLCTEPSVTTYTATAVLDGEEYTNTYTETVVYDSHDYEILTTIEPTATEEGLIEYICTRCGYIYSETVPAIGTTDDEIIDSQQDLSDDRIDMELDGIPSPDDSEDDQPDDTEDTERTESEAATQEQSSETESETEEETAESETEETASEAETETEVQTEEETETESEEETAAQPETDNAAEEVFSLSVSVGETVIFGSYEQDNDLSNGPEDIEWYVAAKEDGKALLVSTYCLDVVSFGEETGAWEDSELNTWLNETFAETAFTDEEFEAVSEVLILSSDEVREYFAGEAVYATAYAKANGAAVYADGTSLYWTSDPASIFRCAEVIRLVSGSSCADDFLSGIAVRAALWVVCE